MSQRVLFVCLGNICRSPLAEAAFRRAAHDADIDVQCDSAGTAAYHVGEPPDPRAMAEAARHGIDISGYRGRQLAAADFIVFDWIVGMDAANMRAIDAIRPLDAKAQTMRLLDLVEENGERDILDPWYGDDEGFAWTWTVVERGAQALLKRIEAADGR